GYVHASQIPAFLHRSYGTAPPATWNLNRAAVRSFVAYARRQAWLEGDPTAGIERRRERTNPDLRVISRTELDALWRRGDVPLREKTLWRLLYDPAARPDELPGLTVHQPDPR